jgi:hypothetical protein
LEIAKWGACISVPAGLVRAGENFCRFLRNLSPQLRYKLWDYCFSLLENSDVPIVKTMQIMPASLPTRLRSEFVASRPDCQTQQVDVETPASIASILIQTTTPVSKSLDVLEVEVFAENYGLRLVKIGANSPFLRLATPGDALLRGAMEIGDRIVAINGMLARHPDDLGSLEDRSPDVRDLHLRSSNPSDRLVGVEGDRRTSQD